MTISPKTRRNKKYYLLPLIMLGVCPWTGFWFGPSSVSGDMPSRARKAVEVPAGQGFGTFLENLKIPWEIVFLSDRTALVT
ncbi:MAG: hypothetical protein HY892_06160 [Deltaproteobacteria bacterium]|nr:hypothetical protein [Deltaproteobacteria bacterium]